jgi:hypothetical protein
LGADCNVIWKTVLKTAVIRQATEAGHAEYVRLRNESTAADPTPLDEYRGLVIPSTEVVKEGDAFDERGEDIVMLLAERKDPQTI